MKAITQNKEEIIWDVDWDGLNLGPLDDVPSFTDASTKTQQTPSPPAIVLAPVQGQDISDVTQQDESVAQIAASQPPVPPPLPSSPPNVVPGPVRIDSSERPLACQQSLKELVRGERFDLGPIMAQKPQISIELISSNPGAVKLICLGLDATEILAGAAYCVGPRQPASPCGGITHGERRDGGQEILFHASILPTTIKRLEISVVASNAGASLGNTVEGIKLRAGELVVAESRYLDPACASSSCATLVEIYERQGTWRMRMIGEVLAHSVNELLAKHGAKTS